MRKITSLLLALLLVVAMCCVGAVSASADTETYTVTGSVIFSPEWNPAAGVVLTEDSVSPGIWYANYDVSALGLAEGTSFEYKVTDGSWTNAWGPEGNVPGSSNFTVTLTAADIPFETITFLFDAVNGQVLAEKNQQPLHRGRLGEPDPRHDPH